MDPVARLREVLDRDVVEAAKSLIGWRLAKGELLARIVEVEAYRSDDPAAHSYKKTKMKNMAMFGPSGHAYVYFSYGVHWMLNVVGHPAGNAAAILIRAAEPIAGLQAFEARRPKARRFEGLLSGPGKLAAAFQIDKQDNGVDLLYPASSESLHLLPPDLPVGGIVTGTRIGIAHGKGHDTLWRFADESRMTWVSRPLTFIQP
ncbi:MAG TPA: DNA-3-methyladenine glycosylase [Fimbriimonadaceae bacterium]|nr:DNA-3-methyladenine glycosylase [Fimbriimonadaceae bacterium]